MLDDLVAAFLNVSLEFALLDDVEEVAALALRDDDVARAALLVDHRAEADRLLLVAQRLKERVVRGRLLDNLERALVLLVLRDNCAALELRRGGAERLFYARAPRRRRRRLRLIHDELLRREGLAAHASAALFHTEPRLTVGGGAGRSAWRGLLRRLAAGRSRRSAAHQH